MNLEEYMEQAGRKFIRQDVELEPTFDHLVDTITEGHRIKFAAVSASLDLSKYLNLFLQGSGIDARPKMVRTLQLYGKLSEEDREKLIRDYGEVVPRDYNGALEAGSFLRGFKVAMDETYDELKARWKLRYREPIIRTATSFPLVDRGNRQRLVQKPLLDETLSSWKFIDAENILPTFTRKYERIKEKDKDAALGNLADLYLLGKDPLRFIGAEGNSTCIPFMLKRILVQANRVLPHNVGYLGSPDMTRKIFSGDEQRQFLFENRDELIDLYNSIPLSEITEWGKLFGLAFQRYEAERFTELPKETLHVLYQARTFFEETQDPLEDAVKNSSIEDRHDIMLAYNDLSSVFEHGFAESLRDGTTYQWAKTIVEHFRRGTIGSANYRVLAGSVA